LITGGASGIGWCTAEEFARAGATVIVGDINAAALESAVSRLREAGGTAHGRIMDVTDRRAVEETARWVADTFGGLDVLINNAGIGHQGDMVDTGLDTWRRLIDVNLWGPLHVTYAFLPSMVARGKGRIVNVSSGQAFFRLPTWGAYAAIKAAEGIFSEVLHFELARHGIGVTTVYPFLVDTPFYRDVHGDTLAARWSMKLLPYYSMTPERVGRIIFEAVRDERRVEMVSVINQLGFYLHLVPPLAAAASRVAAWFLAKGPSPATAGGKEDA
jgi:NAD(P)-dependent dehydrogenase (short-subunit alcohol dehydrogenase family)